MLTGCEFGSFQQDVRSEEIGAARFGSHSILPLRDQLRFSVLCLQLRETQDKLSVASRRLEAANQYFWLKAAELADNQQATLILAQLHENRKLPHSKIALETREDAIVLAGLAGAHLCEITDREVMIIPQGDVFYQRILQHQQI